MTLRNQTCICKTHNFIFVFISSPSSGAVTTNLSHVGVLLPTFLWGSDKFQGWGDDGRNSSAEALGYGASHHQCHLFTLASTETIPSDPGTECPHVFSTDPLLGCHLPVSLTVTLRLRDTVQQLPSVLVDRAPVYLDT